MAPQGPARRAPAALSPRRALRVAAGVAADERDRPVDSDGRSSQLRAISLEYQARELSEATDGWSLGRKLGAGRAGAVYRGELRDGTEVAIKFIKHGGPNKQASGFHDEVQMLSKFRHPNLVTLLGWAKAEDARYLVYELLSGGDLFQRLLRSRGAAARPFTWQERLSVCLDAATGLSHMHNSTPQAFHRDVKSANIVLSGAGTAKMADFGLSCTAGPTETAPLRAVCGTPGYLCPLYKTTGRMSEGSEVYSFGMVMLEVLTGLSPSSNDPAAPGGLAYPIARTVMPQQAGARERCLQSLDRWAAWPAAEAHGFCDHALRCVATGQGQQQRPCFADTVRSLRSMARAAAAPGVPGGPLRGGGAPEQGAAAAAPTRLAAAALQRMQSGPRLEHAIPQASPGSPAGRAADAGGGEGPLAPAAPTLEYVSSKGTSAGELSPSQRALVLQPSSTTEEGSELVAAVGRVHQPELFRVWLPNTKERYAVSRLAFEVSWSPGPGGGPGGRAWLQARSTNPIYVDSHRAKPGKRLPLTSGSEVVLVFEQTVLVKLRFCAHDEPTSTEGTEGTVATAAGRSDEDVRPDGADHLLGAGAREAPEGPARHGAAAAAPPAEGLQGATRASLASARWRVADAGDALMITSKGLDQSCTAEQLQEPARALLGAIEGQSECSSSSSSDEEDEEEEEAPVASKGTRSTGSTGSLARASARPVSSPQRSDPDEAESVQASDPGPSDCEALLEQRAVQIPGPEAAGHPPFGSAQQPAVAARAEPPPSAREAACGHPPLGAAQQPAVAARVEPPPSAREAAGGHPPLRSAQQRAVSAHAEPPPSAREAAGGHPPLRSAQQRAVSAHAEPPPSAREAAGGHPPFRSAQQRAVAAWAEPPPSAREAAAQQPAVAARAEPPPSARAHRRFSTSPASARVSVLPPQGATLRELHGPARAVPAAPVAVAPMVMLELHGEGVLPVPQGQRRIGPLRLEPGQWLRVGRAWQPEALLACVAPWCLESLEPQSFGLQLRDGQAWLLALAAGPVWREQPGKPSVQLSREVPMPAASGDVVTASYTTGTALRRGPSWRVSLVYVR